MVKKPVEPPDRRQRSFEGEDEGPFRSDVRDIRDEWTFRKKAWKLFRSFMLWATAVGAGITAIVQFLVRGGGGPPS